MGKYYLSLSLIQAQASSDYHHTHIHVTTSVFETVVSDTRVSTCKTRVTVAERIWAGTNNSFIAQKLQNLCHLMISIRPCFSFS
jgi:hypothetical protein